MEEYNLEPIIEYSMPEDHAFAYKLGLMWVNFSKKMFPNCRTANYPRKGDPRNSSLFKYCYKLQKETKGLIEPKEYKLYIMAQLQMLKAVEINDSHPLIGVYCLTGDKAWVRWKMWKKKFDNIQKAKTLKEVNLDKIDFIMIKNELDQTKKLIDLKIKDESQFKEMAKDIERWISVGKISGFYAALSPWVKKHCLMKDIDISHYCDNITLEVEEYFHSLFSREF
jgi:hypothetical protein